MRVFCIAKLRKKNETLNTAAKLVRKSMDSGLEGDGEEDALVEHEVVAVGEVEVELGAEFHNVAPAQQQAGYFGAVIPV